MTRTLNADQAERYRTWFENTRRLRELVNELEALSVQVISEAEGWPAGPHDHPEPLVVDTPENVSSKKPPSE